MLKLINHSEVLDALVEQLKTLEIEKNSYETDVYLYINEGKGDLDPFTNVGGNSWLNDDHFTIYIDRPHYNTILDDLVDGVSYGWLIEELECVYNLSGLKEKAYKDITAAIDADILDEDNISCFDDLEAYDVEQWLKKNYYDQIQEYYKERFIPDCCMDSIFENAHNALDEFENTHSFVVLNDGEFSAEYSDYNEAVKAAEELGKNAVVDVWDDYNIDKVKNYG